MEGKTLQGRGVGSAGIEETAAARCDTASANRLTVPIDADRLRAAVREILSEECPVDVEFPEADDFWRSRWLWCVNGAHSRVLEHEEPDKSADSDLDVSRWHRRSYIEEYQGNLLTGWSGRVYYSGSEKLEHGKSRAIFAADTATYVNFSHLLAPIENAWFNKRVVLDPGMDGSYGIYRRMRRLQSRGGVNVMLDYDDFNSQHTLEAQAIVIEEAGRHCGYDDERLGKLVRSYWQGDVYVKGRCYGRLKGTLMSGHRATSFCNSILNCAYLRCQVPNFDSMVSMHVGDDVYISCRGYEEAGSIMDALPGTGLRMNPAKQSVGTVSGEFLRMAVGPNMAYGYAARTVASLISGNWANDYRLAPDEALRSMVGQLWAFKNRTKNLRAGLLAVSTLCRITGWSRGLCEKVALCKVSVNGSPTQEEHQTSSRWELTLEQRTVDATPGRVGKYPIKMLRHTASSDYLSSCATPVELTAMGLAGVGVLQAMVESSYRKTLVEPEAEDTSTAGAGLKFTRVKTQLLAGSVDASEALSRRPDVGLLSKYPLLQLMKGRLNKKILANLLRLVGDSGYGDVYRKAWGTEARTVTVVGWIPYADATRLGGRVTEDILYTTFPMCF